MLDYGSFRRKLWCWCSSKQKWEKLRNENPRVSMRSTKSVTPKRFGDLLYSIREPKSLNEALSDADSGGLGENNGRGDGISWFERNMGIGSIAKGQNTVRSGCIKQRLMKKEISISTKRVWLLRDFHKSLGPITTRFLPRWLDLQRFVHFGCRNKGANGCATHWRENGYSKW